MGSTVGVFTDDQVTGLSDEDRALLKKSAIQHLLTSEEIRKIISAEGVLPTLLKNHPDVHKILKDALDPVLNRLKE
jgi:hypothetical protein